MVLGAASHREDAYLQTGSDSDAGNRLRGFGFLQSKATADVFTPMRINRRFGSPLLKQDPVWLAAPLATGSKFPKNGSGAWFWALTSPGDPHASLKVKEHPKAPERSSE